MARCELEDYDDGQSDRTAMRNAAKLETLEEHTIGTEDRVFLTSHGWWWQCRGSADCWGPFDDLRNAENDYKCWGHYTPPEQE